jgi:hypothetical protein
VLYFAVAFGLRPRACLHGLFLGRLGNRLRREESRKLRARGELRSEWEIDNVSDSHCCLQLGDSGQGRVGASNTSASRYFRLLWFSLLTGSSIDTFSPKRLFHVISDRCQVTLGPNPR